jgi:hypothetical protein
MTRIQKAAYCGDTFAGFPLPSGALLVVRRQDRVAKIVNGAEGRLADGVMWETGLERDWDGVMEKLSGRWKRRLKGFAISEAGDHVAFTG